MRARTMTAYIGPHANDFSVLQGRLVDLEDCHGLRSDQPGFGKVEAELANVAPAARTASGVPEDVYDHFLMCNETVATIDQQLAIVGKQLEVLRESRAFYVDARNNDVSLMVDAIRSRAQRRKDPSLMLPFEETTRYLGQIAEKAVKARKNAAAAEAEAEAEAEAGETDAPEPETDAPAPPA